MSVSRWLRCAVSVGVLGGMLFMATPASADPPAGEHLAKPVVKLSKYTGGKDLAVRTGSVFYAYVSAGETLDATFTSTGKAKSGGTVTVTAPDGTAAQKCGLAAKDPEGTTCRYAGLSSGTAGTWKIEFAGDDEDTVTAHWDITVRSGERKRPGRVWTDNYPVAQEDEADIGLYFLSEFGYQYEAIYRGYNAGTSEFRANAAGLTEKGGCTPIDHNTALKGDFSSDLSRCGVYKVFFQQPDATLPRETALPSGGRTWLVREPVTPKLGKATFAPSTTRPSGGTFKVPVTDHHGTMNLDIDVDNNGSFDDKVDRTLTQGVSASGTKTVDFAWDGRDAKKHAVDRGNKVGVRASIVRAAPIYFVSTDVEGRSGGLEVVHLNSVQTDDRTLYWNDTSADDDSVSPQTISEGVVHGPSLGGARSWDYEKRSWGDNRRIEEWTYKKVNLHGDTASLLLPQRLAKPDKDHDSEAFFVLPHNETTWLILSAVGTAVVGLGILFLLSRIDRKRDGSAT